ncbi:MAG: sigma-54-dependent Fis family transcriptional regulator [Desulfobacterales bacterium]|nr:sigma-54-dependent Fis family transcriptional regulator [Desulfobacterales bacterium]
MDTEYSALYEHLPNDHQLVGESPSFCAEIKKIPIVAAGDASVLISGETGTGKELCAQAIHYLSPRAAKPFVPVNCGAIPVELLENELFGHRAGAFTNASTSQPGLIHEANGGTLFLDEIVSLPPSAQVKLLRFLQEKEYRPLGSTKTYRADVRVIAASNIDVEKAVMEGTLSRNLYYRLNVVPIKLPPLRERREDIPLLAHHFLARYSARFNKQVSDFSPEAVQVLVLHDWPGNVRELEHVVQRAIVLTEEAVIQRSDIVLASVETTLGQEPFKEAKAQVIEQFEKDYITKLLEAYQGNISRAARAAQKNRRAFWELIRKHGIDVQSLKGFRDS